MTYAVVSQRRTVEDPLSYLADGETISCKVLSVPGVAELA